MGKVAHKLSQNVATIRH